MVTVLLTGTTSGWGSCVSVWAALFRDSTARPSRGSPQKRWGKQGLLHINLVGISRPTGLHNSGAKKKKKTKKTNKLNVATWNVRTMLDCDSQPEQRTALISKELARYTIDIAALQETRLEWQQQIQESTHTFSLTEKRAGI